jgi:hypothetical protein
LSVVVDAVEGITCGVHRERRDVKARAIWGSSGDTGCDEDTEVVEPAQFLHQSIDLSCIRSLRVQDRFCVVEYDQHLLGGQERSIQGSQILRVFDTCTGDLGEPAKEMSARGWELVAADESAVVPKPLLDPVVVKNSQGDGSLPDSASANESNRGEVLGEIDDLLDNSSRPKKVLGGRGGNSPGMLNLRCEIMCPTVV